MKKTVGIILLALMLLASLAACRPEDKNKPGTPGTEQSDISPSESADPSEDADTSKEADVSEDADASEKPDTSEESEPTVSATSNATRFKAVTETVDRIVSFNTKSEEKKVSGHSISMVIPEEWDNPENSCCFLYDGIPTYEWLNSLYEVDKFFIFDRFVILSYYKDNRLSNYDDPTVLGFIDHTVETGTTAQGYPYVYYYKQDYSSAHEQDEISGKLFVMVDDNYVYVTNSFHCNSIEDARTIINSIKYN